MRVILLLLLASALSGWGGYALRERDRIASVLLYAFSALTGVLLIGGFWGWFG